MTKSTGRGNKARHHLFGTEKYPDIPIGSIEIVERPLEGEEHTKLFFNPRPSEDFSLESMAELRHSIRLNGLLQNLVVRTVGNDAEPRALELVAGERRLRTLQKLVEDNVHVYARWHVPESWQPEMVVIHSGRFAKIVGVDPFTIRYYDENDVLTDESEEVDPDELRSALPAADVYAFVPCSVIQCNDKEALAIATTENLQRESLSVAAQINLVERLVKMGMNQKQICEALSINATWVSQTLAFRHDLPPDAFEYLLSGRLKRNVAVQLLGYASSDRQKLFDETVKKAEHDNAAKIRMARIEAESCEDLVDVEQMKAEEAIKIGDEVSASRHKSKAENQQKKATAAKEKLNKAQSHQSKIKQSHVQSAAAKLGVAPKKSSKMLTKPEIESMIEKLQNAVDSDVNDPIVGKVIPAEYASLGILFLEGVLEGVRDPYQPIRDLMVGDGTWSDDDYSEDDDEDFVEEEV